MSAFKISVLVVVYNRVELLRRALLSLNGQSYLPAEVVISDDGSQEDIPAGIADILPGVNFRVKYIKQQDKGFRLAKCRNNAIKEAQGDFLIFWDQDILGTKNYIKTFYDYQGAGYFLVPTDPIRLSAKQSEQITDEMIITGNYGPVVTAEQLYEIKRRVFKDRYYQFETKFIRRNSYKPKVRGGVVGVFKNDLLQINGYDENYQGWGREDDDLGRRLYRSGVRGKNVFSNDYPLHLYHPSASDGGKSVNSSYYHERIKEIKRGDIRAKNGLNNPLNPEDILIRQLK